MTRVTDPYKSLFNVLEQNGGRKRRSADEDDYDEVDYDQDDYDKVIQDYDDTIDNDFDNGTLSRNHTTNFYGLKVSVPESLNQYRHG